MSDVFKIVYDGNRPLMLTAQMAARKGGWYELSCVESNGQICRWKIQGKDGWVSTVQEAIEEAVRWHYWLIYRDAEKSTPYLRDCQKEKLIGLVRLAARNSEAFGEAIE